MQRSNNIRRFSTPNRKLKYKWTFMDIFALNQSATVYSFPGTNHDLIQGESSNNSFRQLNYVNMATRNTTDSISPLDNISNPVTANNAYPDEKLRLTPFSSIYDTDSTSYVVGTGANCIILNDLIQFKVLHPCNINVKGI